MSRVQVAEGLRFIICCCGARGDLYFGSVDMSIVVGCCGCRS